jgi:adenine phosphoribosyltransferase
MMAHDAMKLLTWQGGKTTLWPLLASPAAVAAVVDALGTGFEGQVDVIAGPDPGGLLFGPMVAAQLGLPFAPICRDTSYFFQNTEPAVSVEKDGLTLYAHRPLLAPGTRVLLVDDWSESGRTLTGALDLVNACGATLTAVSLLVDSLPRPARDALNNAGVDVRSLARPVDLSVK